MEVTEGDQKEEEEYRQEFADRPPRYRSGRVVSMDPDTMTALPTYQPVSLGRKSMPAMMRQMLQHKSLALLTNL